MLIFWKTWYRQFVKTIIINGLGILFFIAEEEGDVLTIERHCSMELDVGCEFDDDEEHPGVSFHPVKNL